ncbi:hypothetical protein L1994_00590 [Methanomicrobium antiquum]|uniref:Uncharacterized protein n=1 Tax=Methanomicrobium antiquum TaxID=487686 RepID=A0AAF0FQV3_9EURY|nr:hypothetical protein [Methanomicrobium antiquum]WFN36929.1 hypothetical protein L1994_00590 [Methanomicrobium antiquum]
MIFISRKSVKTGFSIFIVIVMLLSYAVAAEKLTGGGDEPNLTIKELCKKNITTTEIYNLQKYCGDEYPGLPYGANIWDENGPVNLSALNKSEKKKYGLESALIGGNGYVVLGYMKNEIGEGESIPFYKQMPGETENFTIDLNWMNTKSRLKLTIFAPDGIMGPYYDESDGLVNGRLFLRISRPEGVESGEWYVVIEAEKTEDKQPFIYLMY